MDKDQTRYLDPECCETAQPEEKCDVYSFGVVLFEVLCARRPFVVHDGKITFLVDCACRSNRDGTVYDIIDPYLKRRIAPECFKMFVDIAGSCTRVVGDVRPEISEVQVMLERALVLLEKADSDPAHMAPYGEYMYEEASFCAFVPHHKSRVDNDSSDVEGVSGLIYPTMDSGDFESFASDELRELR
ncbi:receptor-like protein kinase ANXUR2 [Hibiscus syriacus]|uniref:receptor-like protein kinase ANXUR2 n=1 Tax=Hibiscus syriacus TaxID=106335 RepID=UPI0019246E4F|nr:receptor-like protein kinase ANXUR2 [Hibiscus syriacus]